MKSTKISKASILNKKEMLSFEIESFPWKINRGGDIYGKNTEG